MAAEVLSSQALAKHLVQIGAANAQQISAAKLAHEAATLAGRQVSLGEILVEQGVLTQAMLANLEKKRSGLQQLGPYKLIRKLGEGGMGTVYLAEDTHAQRPVALKVLAKHLASKDVFLKRFKREAIATGKLNHVNIVSAYACDEEAGYHYYAMEYCDGEPLDRTLKKMGRFAPELALNIITQVVRGLQHAHDNHIIHRDIKPANIFVTRDNVAKILDLGLSKSLIDSAQSHMTLEGTTVGTPHYVSPEQARGEADLDGRSDIYSLGATFYMLVTGETPYKGPSPAVIMTKHLTDPVPDPRNVRPSTPTAVAGIIMKMMVKDKNDRYQSCDDILIDLELVAEGKAPLLGVTSDDEGPKPETGRHGRITGKSKRITGKQPPVGPNNEPLIISEMVDLGPSSSSSRRVSKELKVSTRESSRMRRPVDAGDADALPPRPTLTPPAAEPVASEPAPPPAKSTPALTAATSSVTQAPRMPSEPAVAAVTAPAETAPKSGGVPKSMILAGVALLIAGIAVGSAFNGKHDDTKLAQVPDKNPSDDSKTKPQSELPKVVENTGKAPEPAPTHEPAKAKPSEPPQPDPVKPEPVKMHPPEPAPEPPKPVQQVVVEKALEVDMPLPKELLPRPPADPVLSRAPLTQVDDVALEADAAKTFDKVSLMLKRGQFAPAKEALDDMQKRMAATRWYTLNRNLVEAALLQLEWNKQPWANRFAAPARPLTDPPADRWDWRYGLLTTLAYERKDWYAIGNTALTWQVGSWQLEHGGGDFSGLLSNLPITDLERFEATLWPRPGTGYGWALFANARANTPYVTCWIDDDGKVWMGSDKKTALKMHAPTGGGPRKLVVYFRKNRAWMEIGNQREELEIPASPHWMFPALLQNSGALRVSDIRMEGALDTGYLKRIDDENERVKKIHAGGQERYQVKIAVSAEFPCGVFAGTARGSDSKGNYLPQENGFTVNRGSIISIRQFTPGGNPAGPILLSLTLGDGRHTGTGFNPNFWTASSEIGNWKCESNVSAGWLPLPLDETKPKSDAPADSKAKYVLPQDRGILLHYVFDPDDFKH